FNVCFIHHIESHGKGSLFSNIPSWHTTFLERGIRMVERDKNYPSIVSWSLGNEAGFGPNHAALSAWIKEFDPTRPIHAEGAQNIYGYNWPKPEPKDRIYTDFISRMYRPTEDMIDLVTKQGDNRPVIWCEYAHSQANSTGDLEGYWSAIRKYPRFVGGFVWDWRDQLIHKKSEDGRPLWAYGTDFDQNPADLNPIQKGLISADGKIKSGGWQAKYVWQRVVIKADEPASGKFSVFNRHFRTNLNEYDITWKLEKDGKLEARGTSEGVDVAPGQTGLLQLDLPQFEIEARKRYYLTISFVLKKDMPWAKKGFSVASEQFLLAYKPVRLPPSDVQVNNKGQSYELRAQGTTAVIDKNTGRLKSLKINNTEYLLSAPRPNFWRAPTDNDLASGIFDRQGVWKKSTKDMEVASVTCNGIEIEVIFKDEKGSLVTLSYSMQPNGALLLEYHFSPIADLPDIPRIGLQMTTSKELDKLVWFGRGPLETYSDKRSGALTAVYEESVRQDFAYYVRPQESGNKMGVWWFELKDESDKGIRFEAVDQPLSISAWPFSQAAIEKADRIEELEYEDIITVNIDHLQMGVGGDNTWNLDARPHEPFRISAQDYRYSFIIKGVN
ncbi:MAG: glycoside hydrolase family 2 TIM barrel-domain containing protein, partial [Bacteroidota bacterium]